MNLAVETIRTEGLGDSTHVLTFEGQAIVVDPQRDFDRFESVLDATDSTLRFVLETHLHNDYVSGGRELASRHGAEIVMPAGAAPAFLHTPAFHLEDIEMGDLAVRPIHTPGHTPEHVSYLILIDDREVAVFSGGSLLVGSAGRSDLLGMERAESLARLQYRSVTRLGDLEPSAVLYPTHGAGSFCTSSAAGNITSTIGDEKETSPVLSYANEDDFVSGQLANLVPYPSYYPHMAPINLVGPQAPQLTVPQLVDAPGEVTVIDGRPKEDFAQAHIPGSLSVPLRDSFGIWVGWVTDFNTPLVIVLNKDQDLDEAVRQLVRIGYEDIRGVINSLPDPAISYQAASLPEFVEAVADGSQILDVRAPDEWDAGHLTGSSHCYVPDLVAEVPDSLTKNSPVWLACGTGMRASTAASILESKGYEPVVLHNAGVTDVLMKMSKTT